MDISTTSPSVDVEETRAIIGEAAYFYLSFSFRVVLMPVLAVLSLCAAIANVVTFARMGLNQGINQSLLILSASV
ncbi:hypothetical protein RRG08_021571 [Elysia crispata]|uniref:Uncharacterized protein n=1 Tax=Elysia crispata TaxID=231223 RepID=A0AAE0XE62_9GAST|nr:hypothetical protein RRG08_021571 [Elysia crispata]